MSDERDPQQREQDGPSAKPPPPAGSAGPAGEENEVLFKPFETEDLLGSDDERDLSG